MRDFLEDILDGMDEVDEASGEIFEIAGKPTLANFAPGDAFDTLTVSGGKQEHVGGTLVVSRRRCPVEPVEYSFIVGPGKTRYRVGKVRADDASWTLTLTAPNARTNTA